MTRQLHAPQHRVYPGLRQLAIGLGLAAWAMVFAGPTDSLVAPTATNNTPTLLASQPLTKAASQPTAVSTKPEWRDLSNAQRAALSPLAAQWPGITEGQKRKWLALSQNFSALTPTEQAVMHTRMTEWVSLSPQQRSQARLNFAVAREVPVDQRLAHWEAYQALSPEQKQKLAAASSTAKPMGAAPAVKPVAASKLTVTPAATASAPGTTTTAGRSAPRIATGAHQIDRQTLQPKTAPFQIPAPPAELEHETPSTP